MAQFNFAEELSLPDEQTDKIQADNAVIEPTNVMTGDRNQSRFLYYHRRMSML